MLKRSFYIRVAGLILLFSLSAITTADDRLKPFILASESAAPMAQTVGQTRQALEDSGFEVIGEYQPYDDATVLVFSSEALKEKATLTPLGGFAAALRAAVTVEGENTRVSYVNPGYLARAYRLEDDLDAVQTTLSEALGNVRAFGSKKGLKSKKLARYNYMFGMEKFDDTYRLGEFDTQSEAVARVDTRLEENALGLTEVYRLNLPGQGGVLYGVAMQPEAEDSKYFNDAYQMSVVDVGEPRGTAYLPYELLVKDGTIQALHMRFRMALHFPDLSMMGKHSFMTLMPSPGAIEEALTALVAQ